MSEADDLLRLARAWADRAAEAANDRRHSEAQSAAAVSSAYGGLVAFVADQESRRAVAEAKARVDALLARRAADQAEGTDP